MRAVNLLPRELDQATKSTSTPIIAGCAALVLTTVVLAGGYLSASSKVGAQNEQIAALEAEQAAIPKPQEAPSTVAGLPAERQARVTALASALSQRVAWDRLLREVSLVLPEDVWLTTLNAKTPPVVAAPLPGAVAAPAPPPGADVSGFSLQGFTYSQEGVARLLSRLEVIPDLQGVVLQSSTQAKTADQILYQFSIGGSVRMPGAS